MHLGGPPLFQGYSASPQFCALAPRLYRATVPVGACIFGSQSLSTSDSRRRSVTGFQGSIYSTQKETTLHPVTCLRGDMHIFAKLLTIVLPALATNSTEERMI